MPRYCETWLDIAQELGVSTQVMKIWRKKYADSPAKLADGRHDANLWREFMRKRNLAGVNDSLPPEDADEDEQLQSKDDLNRALLREKVRRERIKADIESGKAVLVADIEVPLGALLASIQNGVDSFPDRAAPMVQGFTDVPEISRILHGEMQATVGQLSIFDFERALDGTPEHLRSEVEAALRRIGNFRTEQAK